jgi:uncharacterized repeat protein (TIGR03943 family)
VRKDAQAVVLLLVGGTLLKISLAGTYVRYVKPGLLPLLLITGVVLITIAGVTLWQVIRAQGPLRRVAPATAGARHGGPRHGEARHSEAQHGDAIRPSEHTAVQGHRHDEPWVAWLLLLPALALLMFAPPALGSYQASRNGTALGSQAESDFPPLADGDPVRVSLLDYAGRAVFDQGRSLAGRNVTLSGFIISGPNGEPYLARMIVTCCAADARPVKVGLTGDLPSELAQGRWIEVVGAYTERTDRDPVNSDVIPYLQVSTVRDIPAPELQYES